MIDLIFNNLGTILVLFIILAVIAIIAANMIRNKIQGKSSCGCSSCPLNNKCKRKK